MIRYSVEDLGTHALPEDLIAEAARSWPAPDWDGWLRYESPDERKRTCADWAKIPPACAALLGRLALLDVSGFGPGLVPDLSLHGAGLHAMTAGGFLSCHLDADRHPRLGLERRANAVLFLGAAGWRREWHGQLELWDEARTRPLVVVGPGPGRLVVFETTDQSYHSVRGPLACPEGVQRQTLALYWWGPPRGPAARPRALFVPTAGEVLDPVKERWRRQRAGLA